MLLFTKILPILITYILNNFSLKTHKYLVCYLFKCVNQFYGIISIFIERNMIAKRGFLKICSPLPQTLWYKTYLKVDKSQMVSTEWKIL